MDRSNNLHNNNSENTQSTFPIAPTNNTSEIQKILTTPMTRNRNLKWVEKYLPTLAWFIEYVVKKEEKSVREFGAGEGLLADDIQKQYGIRVKRVDWYKQTDNKELVSLWRWVMRYDISNMQDFPSGLPDMYAIFTYQYSPNAPQNLEDIRRKLRPGAHAYIQFPAGIRSQQALDEFVSSNKDKNIIIYTDTANPSYPSDIFEIRKETETDEPLTIPSFIIKKDLPRQRTSNKEIMPNSELFYQIFSTKNDPELPQT